MDGETSSAAQAAAGMRTDAAACEPNNRARQRGGPRYRDLCGIALAALLTAACASPQSRLLAASDAVALDTVPYFPQQDHQGGPAALAALLHASGRPVHPLALSDELSSRGQIDLPSELQSAVRRHGRVPYVLGRDLGAALNELHAGRPVLVRQNYGSARDPVWRYAVLVGYDPVAQAFTLHTGAEPQQRLNADRFIDTWERGGRWMLVVARADDPPTTADVEGWLRAAAPFEALGEAAVAERAYEAAVRRWPESALAWAALGNVRAQRGNPLAAAQAYEYALKLDAGASFVRNHYAWTLASAGCHEQAVAQLSAGLEVAQAAERGALERTLSELRSADQASAVNCPL